jgi:predicted NodU family carbamoyl transferase
MPKLRHLLWWKLFLLIEDVPDVVAMSGWVKGFQHVDPPLETGYFGVHIGSIRETEYRFLGKKIRFFTSTHERSHIMCSYGMSPFEQGRPCYMLLWEGILGHFYEIDEHLHIRKFRCVLKEPGNKYAFLFSLADPSYQDRFRLSSAGKLMALAAFSDRSEFTPEEKKTADYIIDHVLLLQTKKAEMSWSPFYNIGVGHPDFRHLAGKFSDAIFDRFYQFAKEHLRKGYPLLIGGGCGLNCEWNTKWKNSSLFADVFVPPVPNDAGSAIGTAIDAQYYYSNNAKITWDVYSGNEFVRDVDFIRGFRCHHLNYDHVAQVLSEGKIIGWVQGRCEIGPRALGSRSLLASPFKKEMQIRLNSIKMREGYRPIAPICLEEDVSHLFEWNGPSPYMLYFQKVKVRCLEAITHVDDSARVETVNRHQNEKLYCLLKSFKDLTGYGVLCNTSLNFSGRGFINRLSDLINYAKTQGLDGFVVGNEFYSKI